MEVYLNVEGLARMMEWHQQTVYKKAARGEIPGMIRIGTRLRFKYSAIEEWLESKAVTHTEASEKPTAKLET